MESGFKTERNGGRKIGRGTLLLLHIKLRFLDGLWMCVCEQNHSLLVEEVKHWKEQEQGAPSMKVACRKTE